MVTDMGIEKKSSDRSFSLDQVETIVFAAWKGEGKRDESGSEKKKYSGSCGCGERYC